MKNKFFLLAALLGITTAGATQAEEGWYASVFGGGNWVNNVTHNHRTLELDGGYIVGGAIGYEWCQDFSVEAEFDYRHNDVDKVKRKKDDSKEHHSNHGSLESYAILANLRWDWDIECSTCFTPYIRGGIGYANTRKSSRSWDCENCKFRTHHKEESGFAWKVGGGVTFPLENCWSLSLGYDYLRAQKDVGNNSLTLAANLRF